MCFRGQCVVLRVCRHKQLQTKLELTIRENEEATAEQNRKFADLDTKKAALDAEHLALSGQHTQKVRLPIFVVSLYAMVSARRSCVLVCIAGAGA